MRFELRTIFDDLSVDETVRAIILSGAGSKAFLSGLDVKAASAEGSMLNSGAENGNDKARRATAIRRWLIDFQHCVSSIERCLKRTLPCTSPGAQ